MAKLYPSSCLTIFVSVNEWDGKTDLFNNAVKGVWEGSSWSVSKSEGYVPKTVLLANANSTPEDIRMDAGVKSKVIGSSLYFLDLQQNTELYTPPMSKYPQKICEYLNQIPTDKFVRFLNSTF